MFSVNGGLWYASVVSVAPATGELEGYGWVGAPPSKCSVVNRDMSVPSRYFCTARTVRPACGGAGQKGRNERNRSERLSSLARAYSHNGRRPLMKGVCFWLQV